MLTKDDLKAIKQMIQAENNDLESRFNASFESRLNASLESNNALLESRLNASIDKKLKPVKSDIRKIKNDTNIIARVFDREDVRLNKRVTRIENNLGLPRMG